MVPTILQAVGACLLALFLFAIWPPLALGGMGVFMLVFGLALEAPKPIEGVE